MEKRYRKGCSLRDESSGMELVDELAASMAYCCAVGGNKERPIVWARDHPTLRWPLTWEMIRDYQAYGTTRSGRSGQGGGEVSSLEIGSWEMGVILTRTVHPARFE